MPLHLLGKKSWNVYNQDSIDRVRRDEEKARKAHQQEERESRDKDAARRLKRLRGEDDAGQEGAEESYGYKRQQDDRKGGKPTTTDRDTKRRDRDEPRISRQRSPNTVSDPLDQISDMRFRDAAGRNAQAPWYSRSNVDSTAEAPVVGRDVWGNEDRSRHLRDQKRLDSSDPLLAMKRGVETLRSVEKARAEWRDEREKDLNEVEELARRERHRRRREKRHRSRDEYGGSEENRTGKRHRLKRHRNEDERFEMEHRPEDRPRASDPSLSRVERDGRDTSRPR